MRDFGALSLLRLETVALARNQIFGSIPESIGKASRLSRLSVFEASLTGSLPQAFGDLRQMTNLELHENRLTGALPGIFLASAAGLKHLWMWGNKLRGILPESLAHQRAIFEFIVSKNHLSGSVPCVVSSMSYVRTFHVGVNQLHGALPEQITELGQRQFLVALVVASNTLSGTIPQHICSLKGVVHLSWSSNWIEGSLPHCLSKLRNCRRLGMCSAGHGPQMHGSLPAMLARAHYLSVVVAHSQKWEGHIPAFSSTVATLSLHQNDLLHMPELRLSSKTIMVLHKNRLSCTPPSCKNQKVQLSLVAVSNHLSLPSTGRLPEWVSPFEKDGLFWSRADIGRQLFFKVFTSCIVWAFSLKKRLSLSTLVGFSLQLEQWPSIQVAASLHACMATHMLGSLILIALVLSIA